MLPRNPAVFVLLLLLAPATAIAQGTAEDYLYSAQYPRRVGGKVFRDSVAPVWTGADNFWYRVKTGNGKFEFVAVDAIGKTRLPAFDHEKLAAALRKQGVGNAAADSLPFATIRVSDDTVSFRAAKRSWTWDTRDESLREVKVDGIESSTISKGVEVLSRLQPSSGRGSETHVTFRNQLKEPVEVFWVDDRGRHQSYEVIPAGGSHRQHTYGGHAWVVKKRRSGQVVGAYRATEEEGVAIVDGKNAPKQAPPRTSRRRSGDRARGTSPDGKWKVTIEDHNVVLSKTSADSTPVELTADGSQRDSYRSQVHWSPDSQHFVIMRRSEGEGREVHMVQSSPGDQLQPRLHTHRYAKPGDELPTDSIHLFNAADARRISLDASLWENPWSISDLRWREDSSSFSFFFNQRGHQVLRLIRVAAADGKATAVIDEQSETFIDYAGKRYLNRLPGDEAIWMSERDGWNHLYLYDTSNGTVKNQITKGPWVVRRVERVDEDKRQIWFQAGGVYPDQDPYYVHLCRVDFDGSNFVRLTAGDGTHSWKFSEDSRYLIDTYSRVDMPPVTELRRCDDGELVCVLERADWSYLRADGNWNPPEPFVAKGRDGSTNIHGVIVRPTRFDPKKKYPVIEHIYAGPHSAFAPKSFGYHHLKYQLAELGFIVVQMDGMGTSHRSKAFHDVAHKNLGDSGFPDRIAWIQAAAKKYPEMDIDRVGIFGGSAGGQSALRALIAHGDFYKVAVSDCGCHDNRMDKVWWNELWMGWPIGPHYAEQSNVTQAHRLEGKLLLTVGELDRNVDPASTMQVVDALIKANKDFDLIVFPSAGHGIGESAYGKRRRRDFFVRHLWGMEPRRASGG